MTAKVDFHKLADVGIGVQSAKKRYRDNVSRNCGDEMMMNLMTAQSCQNSQKALNVSTYWLDIEMVCTDFVLSILDKVHSTQLWVQAFFKYEYG